MPHTNVGTSEDLLAELATWVAMETPTTDPAAVNRLMDVAEGELARAGAALTRIPGRDGFGDNLIARTPGEGKPVLVAGHLDTVWSHGTLDGMPYQVNGEKAHGPGIYDMKAGSFLAFHAVRSILRQKVKTRRPIVLLLTPDEEVGSPTSREWIEREAAAGGLRADPGAGRPWRRLRHRAQGRRAGSSCGWKGAARIPAARSRRAPRRWWSWRGRSCGIHDMVDIDRGITLNAAPVWGGSRPNVISPDAGCEIDLRVNSVADGERMERTLLASTALTPGCRVVVEGGMNRPPYTESAGHPGAVRQGARRSPSRWGWRCRGSIAAAGRTATSPRRWACRRWMGWAVPGAGAHASHEHILWQHLAPRAALMAGLLETLE